MDLSLALRGLLLGFAIAAPVGPIGVLCIRRTLAAGWRIGFVSGLGAATADALYGAVAAFGLTAVSGLLVADQLWLRLVGGVFLGYLGLRALLTKPGPPVAVQPAELGATTGTAPSHPRGDPTGGRKADLVAYTSTLGLTLTNPATILSFAAVFAGLGVGSTSRGYLGAALLVAGVFAGSALWWLILSSTVTALRSRFRPGIVGWVGRASGAVLLAFGLLALVSIVQLVH